MKPDDMFILNRKNANQNIIFCYTWRFYLLFNKTYSGIFLYHHDVFTGVTTNFNTNVNTTGAFTAFWYCLKRLSQQSFWCCKYYYCYNCIWCCYYLITVIFTAFFITIAVRLCLFFLIKDITKLREHYRTVILNHSETRLHITTKR